MGLYPTISRRMLYPLYEWIARRQFTEKLSFLEKSQWWDPFKLQEYQWLKFKKLLQHAFERNSFYREKFLAAGLQPDQIRDVSDLVKVPLLSKAEVAKNLPKLISDGYNPDEMVLDKTSGSTGRNLIFYNDRATLDWMSAAVLRNMAWYNIGFGDKRFKLWGSLANESLHQRIYMCARNFLLREYIFSSYELSTDKLALIVRQLRKHRVKALVGYVSALEVLARFVEQNKIKGIVVPAVIPAAETLFEHQRDLFERVFRAKVFNRYGSHEFTSIAHECEQHRGMHINSEMILLEVLKDGRPAAPGEMGEIVITDLENFGFPFIRYRMEDLGRLTTQACACGRGLPVLESVEGRVYDLVYCPNGAIQTGTFFCKMTRSVEGINEFQVIQEAKDRLRFKLVVGQGFQSHAVSFLRDAVKAHCGAEMEVGFDFVEQIEPLKSGKRRYVVSLSSVIDNRAAAI